MKRNSPELAVHRSIMSFLQAALPDALIHHSANEIGLKGTDVARQIAKAKYMGMQPGWPDIEILHKEGIFFVEVKGPAGKLTEAQKNVAERMIALGHKYTVARSIDDVVKALEHWGIPHRGKVS